MLLLLYDTTMKTFTCPKCEKIFTSHYKQKYCSHSCASLFRAKRCKELGIPYILNAEGIRAYRWKGGRSACVNGYIRVWVDGIGYRYEHRVVMEKMLGRPLLHTEAVHHIDGDRKNNNESNLSVMLRKEHDSKETLRRISNGWKGCFAAITYPQATGKCLWCGSSFDHLYPSEAKHRRFCSKPHRGMWIKEQYKNQNKKT